MGKYSILNISLPKHDHINTKDKIGVQHHTLIKVSELKHRVKTSDEQHAKRTAGLEVKLIKTIGENMALREK